MRFQTSQHNPLKDILYKIPYEGLPLRKGTIVEIAAELQKGGIICETLEEVISCLELLSSIEYNIISMTSDGSTITLKRIKHGN